MSVHQIGGVSGRLALCIGLRDLVVEVLGRRRFGGSLGAGFLVLDALVFDVLEDEEEQPLEHFLVFFTFHELVEQLIVDHSLLHLLAIQLTELIFNPLLFLEEILEVLCYVSELL